MGATGCRSVALYATPSYRFLFALYISARFASCRWCGLRQKTVLKPTVLCHMVLSEFYNASSKLCDVSNGGVDGSTMVVLANLHTAILCVYSLHHFIDAFEMRLNACTWLLDHDLILYVFF